MAPGNSKMCPCCSGKSLASCCGPFISGFALPPSPEALMRSRYTAYTLVNIDYIARTMSGPAKKDFDPAQAQKWAQSVHWEKLEVLSSSMDGETGQVYFKAYFSDAGKPQILTEHSAFKLMNGRWMYVSALSQK